MMVEHEKRIDVMLFERGLVPSHVEKARALHMACSVYVTNREFDKPGDTVGDDAAIEVAAAPLN